MANFEIDRLSSIPVAYLKDGRMFLRMAEADLDLRVTEVNGKKALSGQIVPLGDTLLPPTAVHLLHHNHPVRTDQTNYIGEFDFEDIPSGPFVLQFESPDIAVPIDFTTDCTRPASRNEPPCRDS